MEETDFKAALVTGADLAAIPAWSCRQFGSRYIVSIADRVELMKTLDDFCTDRNIVLGAISGIGAVEEATLRFFDPSIKQYIDRTFQGQMEIVNLTGNISTMDGKLYLHVHVTLGSRDYRAIAGHLLRATIHGAGELMVETFPGRVERSYAPGVGLNLYDFSK